MTESEGNHANEDSAPSPIPRGEKQGSPQKKNQETNDDRPKKVAAYFRYYQLGLQLVVAIVLFTGAGVWLDRQLGTLVLFTVLGFAIGFAGGIYSVFKDLPSSRKNDRAERRGMTKKDGRDDAEDTRPPEY